MKKELKLFGTYCLFIIALCSCRGSGTDKADNAIKYGKNKNKNLEMANNAIQDCLYKNDFEGAHKILNQIPLDSPFGETVISYNGQYNLQDKVYQAEISYLVEQGDDAAWQKAYILVVQYKDLLCNFNDSSGDAFNRKLGICELLSDYAVVFGHEETAKRLIKYVDGILNECETGKKNANSIKVDDWQRNINKAQSIITKLESIE